MTTHYTMAEQETIVRWDRTDEPVMLWTADPNQAERWRKLNYDVKPHGPHGWQSTIPKTAVRFKRLVSGIVPKKVPSAAFLAARHKKKTVSQGND